MSEEGEGTGGRACLSGTVPSAKQNTTISILQVPTHHSTHKSKASVSHSTCTLENSKSCTLYKHKIRD